MNTLDRIFNHTAEGEAGNCPLPEPGRGAPTIEQPGHLRIKNQPEGYDYDRQPNAKEAARFRKQLAQMIKAGQCTQE